MSIEFKFNQQAINKIEDAAFKALQYAAEHILTESIRTVPKDTGLLQQSGKVSSDKSTMEAVVSYDTPYAVRLHEHPEYNFQNGRRGKWLELTILEQQSKIGDLIAAKMRGDINAG
jgi:hypothetical protein